MARLSSSIIYGDLTIAHQTKTETAVVKGSSANQGSLIVEAGRLKLGHQTTGAGTWHGNATIDQLWFTGIAANLSSFRWNESGVDRMTLTAGGNLLIGTTTDNGVDKLQVNGSVSATTFKGALTGTASNADKLGGELPSSYLRSDVDDTFNGQLEIKNTNVQLKLTDSTYGDNYWMFDHQSGDLSFKYNNSGNALTLTKAGNVNTGGNITAKSFTSNRFYIKDGKHSINNNDGSGNFNIKVATSDNNSSTCTENGYGSHWTFVQNNGKWEFRTSSSSKTVGETYRWNTPLSFGPNTKVWTSDNDGSGSELDADTLDNQHGSFYTNASNLTTGTVNSARLPVANSTVTAGIVSKTSQIFAGVKTFNDAPKSANGYETGSATMVYNSTSKSLDFNFV